ncbi:MAG: DUF1523 family protein [Candidatus Thorarchaeota archaeon]|jgi:hypothetical protein
MNKKKSSARPLILGVIAIALMGFGGCTVYKWTGTGTHTGIVQRAYEKADKYRIEFVTNKGDVLVFENKDSTFPYFKTNTANIQADFSKAEKDGSEVEVVTWGWRNSMASWFPNVISLEVKDSDKTKKFKAELKTTLEELLHEKLTVEQAVEKIEKQTRSR